LDGRSQVTDTSSPVNTNTYDDLPKPARKPPWLRVRLPSGETYRRLKELMRSKSLHTVCEEAMCPNMAECWGCGTATFLILGDTCTRGCTFCAVRGGTVQRGVVDWTEALEVAEAVSAMNLKHAVVTSVTRDDLPDGGAALFAETIKRIRDRLPECSVEVLIPDFMGKREAIEIVVEARPEIFGHNVETVPRLYSRVRPQASYKRSLDVLRTAKVLSSHLLTKSGLMVGLGERIDEIRQVMRDLREVGCDILTIGQYLRPTQSHLPVVRYYTPEEFSELREAGYEYGFRWVESGPLVRSSYHADAQALGLKDIP
jgi:lipoyl synthase